MKALKCEMCTSNDMVKQDGMYVCQACGTKYTVEEAQKLMVEVDNSKNIENWYTLARRANDNNDSESAVKYYSMILEEEPNSWEATLFSTYYRCTQGRIGDIYNNIREPLKTPFGKKELCGHLLRQAPSECVSTPSGAFLAFAAPISFLLPKQVFRCTHNNIS